MATRIAHFTDIHFTELPSRVPIPKLFSKRLLGWANMVALGRYADFEDTAYVARALVDDLAALNLDGVVFTGDLTGLALASEFAAARDALAPLVEDPRVVGIPGNHDVYTFGAARAHVFERTFPSWGRSDLPDTTDYPIVRLYGEDAAVLAVKDVRPCLPHDSSGRLSTGQIHRLRTLRARPELQDRVVILAMHYCIRMPNGERDSYLHRLRNDLEVRALAEELDIAVIVCGHVHHRAVFARGDGSPVAFANPGSVSHGRRGRSYHVLTIDDGAVHLEARRFDRDAGVFAPWDDAPGAGRLY